MAGVGFELKKLFGGKGYFSNIKAYSISMVVTVGPTILCILMITMMGTLLSSFGENYRNKQLFLATIIYAFAFSLIITGGFSMVASRYVSDCIYGKKSEKILPSFFGFCAIPLIIAFFMGSIFLLVSQIPTIIQILTYILFAELIVIWIESVYLSAVRYYMTIVYIFVAGLLSIGSAFFISHIILQLTPIVSVLAAMVLGFMMMMVLFFMELYKVFPKGAITFSSCFEFLKAIDNYIELLLVGIFYYLGMYGHNFVFWLSKEGMTAGGIYRFSPEYDLPVFYALLTIMPAMILFVVKVETSFYEKYKEYYSAVLGNASIKDIKRTRAEMVKTLSADLRHIIEVQFFISITSIVIGTRLLPHMGFTMLSVDIFQILAIGSLAYIVMYIISIILLYFNDTKGAMYISLIFFLSSVIFTIISVAIGDNFYGYGFFFSAFVSMLIAFFRLDSYLKNIDYYTFGLQPIFVQDKSGIFSKLYKHIVRLEERSK